MTAWLRRSVLVLATCFLMAAPAFAQGRVPDRGMGAIGLSFGAALPSEDVLSEGWFMAASGEWYLTPRFSIRGQLAGSWWDVSGGGLDGKVSPMHITGNGVYNWERGKWHPYVSGGIGWYRYRFGEGDNRLSDDKVGVNLGGGIEYFFTGRDVITGDVTLHIVPGHAESFIWDYQARYWTIAGGYKRYF
jgi:hypothetical protein